MKKQPTFLSNEEIISLKKNHEVISVLTDMDIVYEKQIPIAGLVLIQGEIEFTKKYKTQGNTTSSCIVGVNEVLNELPVSAGFKVKKNSEVILLGKSELIKAHDEHSEIFPIIRKFLQN